ncbi:MAG: M36 family metallopeptidase, partial [Acidobacteriota bacterium]
MSNIKKLIVRAAIAGSVTLSLFVLALLFIPQFSKSKAGESGGARAMFEKTVSHQPGLENYDIRTSKGGQAKLREIRDRKGKDAVAVANIREAQGDGEQTLRKEIPNLLIEYSEGRRTPEVIAVDPRKGVGLLTAPMQGDRAENLRSFARENKELIGLTDYEISSLKVRTNYKNPEGGLSFAHLEQQIDGIPVFQGEIKAGFTKSGELIRVINNLAPGLANSAVAADFGDPVSAVYSAYGNINSQPTRLDTQLNERASTKLKAVFGEGDYATTAEKMYFPTEPGVVVPAWRVLIWEPVNAYYVIIDAESGTMLWRKNITEDQTQTSSYGVYVNPNAMINVADSPFPLTPGPANRNGAQGADIGRTTVSRIGNEGLYSFNNLGWITDGGTITAGNNVRAGIDRDGTDGVDTNGEAVNASRNFVYTYTPFNPNTVSGEAPIPTTQSYPPSDYQQGTVTQMFWIVNWYHDEMYRLGFTETAGNFQTSNFSRGGNGGDRVNAEGQDSSGTNNANFSTPADGGSGRMQMYIWTGPNPDLDGNLDADVVIHELTHGLSNRLHGNSSGLSTNMSRGMGEGWSDFYAHSMLSEPTDPLNGVYTTGGYATYLLGSVGTNNYYYGIRRFPKAVIAFTGGASNRPHNPLTFADIDSTQYNAGDGAFAPAFTPSATDQVHAAGEIWSSALWEVRGQLVQRLGAAAGNRKALQLVTDGMKLAPLGPTFLQERDAIIAAARASSSLDVRDVWTGFALRGMGASATVNNQGTGNNTARVTEAFDLPSIMQIGTFTISDLLGDNDGYFEPGERLRFTTALTNAHWDSATSVTLQAGNGPSVSYGTIASGASATQTVEYTLPLNLACGSATTITFTINSSLGTKTFQRSVILGQPSTNFMQGFDGVTAPAIPQGWTADVIQSGINFVTSTNYADSAPNSAFAANPATVGGGTDLTSPSIAITSPAATGSFRHRYDTEAGWDGGALEISIDTGAFQDLIVAGGAFLGNGYNGSLGSGTNNPLSGRNAWSGNSGGFVTTSFQLPAAAAGKNIRLKFRMGSDDNTVGTGSNPGWYVDSVAVNGSATCSYSAPNRPPMDFDGDSKTYYSIFRPSGTVGAEWW